MKNKGLEKCEKKGQEKCKRKLEKCTKKRKKKQGLKSVLKKKKKKQKKRKRTGKALKKRLVGFYGISTFVGYLTPNPFLYKYSVVFQTIQFSMSRQFNCQKHFYFKPFSLIKQF